MASAAASRPPAPPPPPAQALQWFGPRVSFSLDDAAGGGGSEAAGAGASASSADFEFLLAAVSMLPADELFSGGKLVPLRIPASTEEAPPKTTKQAPEVKAGEEPKVPARRWRDLLRLRKQQASSGPSEPRPLRRLLRRGPKPPEPEPSLSLPLLREPNSDEPASAPPVPSATSSQHPNQLPPKIRLSPSPPPPPPADSPRLNAAGKVVFNGLGRSSSSPSSLAGGRRNHRGAMERSYSAHVRVAPVLNVPVCSLRGSRKSVPVFGIDRLFSPSSSAGKKAKAAAAQ